MEEQRLVNGSLLKKYVGQSVRLFLKLDNVSSGGRQLQGTTTDKKTIDLKLDQPLNQPLTGWVEVLGTPISFNSVNCSEIIVFPSDENSEPLDEEAHNGIVMAIENMSEFYEMGGDAEF